MIVQKCVISTLQLGAVGAVVDSKGPGLEFWVGVAVSVITTVYSMWLNWKNSGPKK